MGVLDRRGKKGNNSGGELLVGSGGGREKRPTVHW